MACGFNSLAKVGCGWRWRRLLLV